MKKLLSILIFSIFLISLISAQTEFNLGTFAQGTNLTLLQTCENCTYINLSTMIYPNSSIALLGEFPMVKNGTIFTYYFNDTNTLGTYFYITHGDLDGVDTLGTVEFIINYNGKELSTPQSVLYSSLFVVLVLFIFVVFYIIIQLPDENERDEGGRIMSVSYLKYFRTTLWMAEWMLMVAVLYLSSNLAFAYLPEQLFANILFVLFRITFGITPVLIIVMVVYMFVRFFHDKEFQNLLNRGIFPQGRL